MNRDKIFSVIKTNMVRIIPAVQAEQPIDETQSMADYGADSLEMVEVVSRSMKQLKVRIPRTKLSDARNLKDLIDLFEQAAAETERS